MRYHMLTSELIRKSGETARHLGQSYVSSGHLLLALMHIPGEAGQLLRGVGLDG